jgi:hypothetical protein
VPAVSKQGASCVGTSRATFLQRTLDLLPHKAHRFQREWPRCANPFRTASGCGVTSRGHSLAAGFRQSLPERRGWVSRVVVPAGTTDRQVSRLMRAGPPFGAVPIRGERCASCVGTSYAGSCGPVPHSAPCRSGASDAPPASAHPTRAAGTTGEDGLGRDGPGWDDGVRAFPCRPPSPRRIPRPTDHVRATEGRSGPSFHCCTGGVQPAPDPDPWLPKLPAFSPGSGRAAVDSRER